MLNKDILSGKTAVVTGAGRGIGRSIALELAKHGADIAGCSRSVNELDELETSITAMGRKAVVVPTDITNHSQVSRFRDAAISEFGHIDILVNNAGGGFETGPFCDSTIEGWKQAVDVNLMGTYYSTRLFLDNINNGGKIINIASGMGLQAVPGNSSYAVAKAGVHMLTQVLALELWDRGIDVNDVIPGLVATTNVEWASDRSSVETVLAEFQDKEPPFAPSERVKHPDELGDLILWIAVQEPGGPTGQSFSLGRRPF